MQLCAGAKIKFMGYEEKGSGVNFFHGLVLFWGPIVKIYQESGFQFEENICRLKEDDISRLRSQVKVSEAVRVGGETWIIPPSGHLTGPASFSASDWSSFPTYAACKSAPSLFSKQSMSRDVQS